MIRIIPITFMALVASCSAHQKEPVSDLDLYRSYARSQAEKGPLKPQVLTETVVVERPTPVPVVQAEIDKDIIQITTLTPENKPDQIFIIKENTELKISIKVTHSLEKLTTQLAVTEGLPQGATLKKNTRQGNQDIYELTWKPNLLPSTTATEVHRLVLTAASTSHDENLKILAQQTSIAIVVTK